MADNKQNKRPNVPPLRFPEFTEPWERKKVSDILDFYSTNSLSWEQLEFANGDLRNLHYGMIHVGLPTLVDLAKDELPNIKQGNVPRNYELCIDGDVAFADASEDTNDVAKAIELINTNGQQVVFGLHTIHGRDNKGLTAKGFKGYAFASKIFHDQIKRIAQGTKIFSISSKNFAECYIGLPTLQEQRKIAHLLSIIDHRITVQNKLIEKLQSLMGGIIDGTLYKRKYRLSGYVSEWKILKLGDLGVFVRGLSYDNNSVVDDCTQTLVIRSNNISQGKEVDLSKDVVYVDKIPEKEQMLQDNDIVFCMATGSSALVGKNSVYNGNYNGTITIGAFCGIYRGKSKLTRWLLNSSQYHRAIFNMMQGGNGAIANLKGQDILSLSFNYPSEIGEERRLITIFSTLEKKIAIEKQLLELYEKQKQYLLSQMFI